MRDRLIELMHEFYGVDPMYYGVEANALADHLIANGVICPHVMFNSVCFEEKGGAE